MQLLLYLLMWIGSIGLAIFSNQNIYLVTVKLASLESIKLPLGLVLIFCVEIGAFFATFLMTFSSTSSKTPLSNISSTSNPSTKTSFQGSQKEVQKVTSRDEFTKKKRNVNDDFDSGWDDNWD